MRRWLAGLTLASTAFAQTGAVQGPVLGVVFDETSAAIRPLSGVPGAASLGEPLFRAEGLRGVVASASGNYAIGIDAAGGVVLMTPNGRRMLPITGATRVYISSRGGSAAVYRAQAGAVDVVGGLPDAPRVDRTVAMDVEPAGLAVSEDGAAVVALTRRTRNADAVSWIGRDGVSTVVHQARRIESVWLIDSSTALIAEPRAVKLVSPAFGAQTVADGVAGILGAAASTDGAKIAIALRSGAVILQDRASGARTVLPCACNPAELVPVKGNAVFRLNKPGRGPLWLLDADSPSPRVTFVAVPGGAQ